MLINLGCSITFHLKFNDKEEGLIIFLNFIKLVYSLIVNNPIGRTDKIHVIHFFRNQIETYEKPQCTGFLQEYSDNLF